MPTPQNICPKCGKPLAPEAPMGRCPECLNKLQKESARPVRALRWRDRWMWDTANLVAMILAPVILCSILALMLFPWLGTKALWIMLLAPIGLLFAAIYGWVGLRIRRLKAAQAQNRADLAEVLIARRPFQSPGLAILHEDRLELVPIVRAAITVSLADIVAINEVRWFNGTRLWFKRGFVLELKDGQRILLAVPDPFARDWRRRLSHGALP